jgi:hypothetical protein
VTAGRVRKLVAPLAVAAGGLLAALGGTSLGVTVCPFALLTGHACPGCGLTRAVGALLTGDLPGALRLHPLAGLVAAQIALAWMWWLGRRLGWKRMPAAPPAWVTPALALTALALVAVWGIRWTAGTLPPV